MIRVNAAGRRDGGVGGRSKAANGKTRSRRLASSRRRPDWLAFSRTGSLRRGGNKEGRAILHIPAAATRGTREDAVNIANGSLIGVISGGVRPREGGGEVAEAF